MKNPEAVVKRWSAFVAFFAVAASVGAVVCLTRIGTADWSLENLLPQFAMGVVIVSALLWAGLASLEKDNPSLAGAVIIVAGVMSLPVGIVLIIAGLRLRSAARALRQQRTALSGMHSRSEGPIAEGGQVKPTLSWTSKLALPLPWCVVLTLGVTSAYLFLDANKVRRELHPLREALPREEPREQFLRQKSETAPRGAAVEAEQARLEQLRRELDAARRQGAVAAEQAKLEQLRRELDAARRQAATAPAQAAAEALRRAEELSTRIEAEQRKLRMSGQQ